MEVSLQAEPFTSPSAIRIKSAQHLMSWVAREGSGFQKRNCWLEQSHCGINNSLRWNPLAPIPLGIPVSHYILLLPILAQESVVRYPPLFHHQSNLGLVDGGYSPLSSVVGGRFCCQRVYTWAPACPCGFSFGILLLHRILRGSLLLQLGQTLPAAISL